MNEFTTNVSFDPLNDVDLTDIDFEFSEDEETGQVSYDKPEVATEEVEETEDYSKFDDSPVDVHSILAELPDEEELNLGERKMSKGKLLELAQKDEEIENEHSYVNNFAMNLRHSEKHLNFIKQRSLSEVDHQIAAIDQILNDPQISDAERGSRHRQRQSLVKRQDDLNNEFQRGEQLIEAQKSELLGYRIKETDEAMQRKYGAEWATSAKDVYDFAIGYGISPDALKEALSPALADIFVMARKYTIAEQKRKERTSEEIKATIARSKTPRKTQTVSVNNTSNTAAQQKVLSGKASLKDLADAYPF